MDSVLRGLNAGLMIGLGLALGAWLAKRRKVPWGLFGIGAATFVASQIGHIPFNSLILSRVLDGLGWADMTSTGSLIGASALLGLSAGIFEEGARYLMYRFWAKKARSWDEALMIGAGHGGVEAILLGLLTVYALVQALALRGVDLATIVPADQVEAARLQLAAYWAAPWYASLLGAVERAFAICLHLSLGVMVMQCFTRREWFWLPLAIGWHALVDGVALVAIQHLGPYWTEALVGVMAIISLGILFALRPNPAPATASPGVRQVESPPLPAHRGERPTQDQLDDSRFAGRVE
jgi:uncharacterized membrane protein YhfC